jgi:competence protein ComEC
LWFYGLAFLALNWNKGWARTGLRLGAAAGLNVLVWQSALHARVTQVTFLDPGKGDCVLLEDTLGRVSLFDAGVSGQGVLRDYLRFRGIHQIDLAMVSHPDNDHYGGFLDLGRQCAIRHLVAATDTGGTEYCELLDRLRQRGTELTVAGKGGYVRGLGFGLRFLWPEKQAQALFRKNLLPSNAVSLVAMCEHARFRMLLTGDLDEPELIADQDARAELLKSPHHGSTKGNPDSLYARVRPDYVVVMGRYPTPAGLETRLAGYGERYVNTRERGAWGIRFVRRKPVFGYLLPRLEP